MHVLCVYILLIIFDAQISGIFLSSLLCRSVQLLVLVVPSLKLTALELWSLVAMEMGTSVYQTT